MPKKAKKGGGGKGGRTEEERLMLLQQRAQAEEEVAKKKEEILTLFLKDKLQKEERNTVVNLLKLNDGWRSILRLTRAGELRRDVTALSQTFERQLDGLDGVVKNLACDLQEAERQSAQVWRAHLQHAERLQQLQDGRLRFLQQQWESSLQQLHCSFSRETKQISADAQQQRDALEDAALTVEQQHQAAAAEIHRVFSEGIAAYDTAYEQRKPSLRMDTKEPLKQERLRKQETQQLSWEEMQEAQVLNQQSRQLIRSTRDDTGAARKLQDQVASLRTLLSASRTEDAAVERDLLAARDRVKLQTRALQGKLLQAQTAARTQLSELTVQSAAAAARLQDAIAKGHQVLRVADMCRRMEAKHREVLASSLPLEGGDPEEGGEPEEGGGPEAQTKQREMRALQQVGRSINVCVLLQGALTQQREELRLENQQLKLLLRQHQDAMTLSGGDLDALLAVSRAPTSAAPPDADRRHAVIEAVHAVKHSL